MADFVISPFLVPVTAQHQENSQYDPTNMNWALGIVLGPGAIEVN